MNTIIRLALTGFILFMVYRETGPWTVVAFALIFLGMELSALVLRQTRAALSDERRSR